MRNKFDTVRVCRVPALLVIKKMKLILFHYIISQKEESLMFRFLRAQRKDPIKGDWYSIILEIMQEFDFGGNE